jgi:hypothetical protein
VTAVNGANPEARDERLANNEVVFRAVNESIDRHAVKLGGLDEHEFVCECSSSGCFDRIALTLAEYEAVRRHGKRFFVAPGHEDFHFEHIVESRPTFLVVEKVGVAGVVADETDPRSAGR